MIEAVWPDADIHALGPAIERLAQVPVRNLTERDIALHAGLKFCDSIARGNVATAAEMLEAVGYHPLPRSGELSEQPAMALLHEKFAAQATRTGGLDLSGIALTRFSVLDHRSVARDFPAVAAWMLPSVDYAFVIDPEPAAPGWVQERCCLVVRVRARRPTIMGGTLLESLRAPASLQTPASPAADPPPPPPAPTPAPPREIG